MAKKKENRFYEEGGNGLTFKKEKVTAAERKRAEELLKELCITAK